MSNDAKSLSVAAAFAAAVLATAPAGANAPATQVPELNSPTAELQPSKAALERIEEAAKTAWIWWPWPPKFVELWPEVTHVESIRTA